MIVPESGRIVVIDDKYKEVEHLVKLLSRHRAAITYFTGRREELPETPFHDVRLVFLDVVLEGLTGRDTKTIISTLMGVLRKIIDADSGVFIVVMWTKHPEYVDPLKESLRKENYRAIVIDMDKEEFFDNDSFREDMFETLNNRLDAKLGELDAYNLLVGWENLVNNSAAQTANELSGIIQFDDADSWNKDIKQIFVKMASGWAGKTLNVGNSKEILQNSFYTFNKIFEDAFSRYDNYSMYFPSGMTFLDGEIDEDIIARINSRLLLDFSDHNNFYPGNVYELNSKDILKKIVRDAINYDTVTFYYKKYKCSFKANECEISKNKFTKILTDELKKNSFLIEVEVSPVCDLLQGKIKKSRRVPGLLIDVSSLTLKINHLQIDIPFQDRERRLDLIKARSDYLYVSPVFWYEGYSKNYILILDFRYLYSKDIRNVGDERAVFRLRKNILDDIQIKLSTHINRIGVLYLE